MNNEMKQRLTDSGMDVDGALHRLMDNEGLYIRLLGKFLDDKNCEELEACIGAGDYEKAFHAAHTLKGVAANLGLAELAAADEVVVERLRVNDSEGIGEDLKKVTDKYKLAVDAICALLAEK